MARRWLRPALVAFLASASLWVGSSALLTRQTTGCLRVEARDSATDRLVHSRFYLTDSTGVPQTPSGLRPVEHGARRLESADRGIPL
jgi:hypothetical protein